MGSSDDHSFENLFVGSQKKNYIYPSCWMCYIGDTFLFWEGSEPEFFAFVDFFNNIFPQIVFNPEVSSSSITFLDVKIPNMQDTVTKSIYMKLTDQNTLLHYCSAQSTFLTVCHSNKHMFWWMIDVNN